MTRQEIVLVLVGASFVLAIVGALILGVTRSRGGEITGRVFLSSALGLSLSAGYATLTMVDG